MISNTTVSKTSRRRFLAWILAAVMIFSLAPGFPVLADDDDAFTDYGISTATADTDAEQLPEGLYFLDPADGYFDPLRQFVTTQMWQNRESDGSISALTQTLGLPVGMVGFEGAYALTGNMANIIVQFRTPSSVALRLMAEANHPQARAFANFDAVAQAAHDEFFSQLAGIPMPFGRSGIEINRRYITLINGVSMRVPSHMVESIAALPEVFAVVPRFLFPTLQSGATGLLWRGLFRQAP